MKALGRILTAGMVWSLGCGFVHADQVASVSITHVSGAPVELLEATGRLLGYYATPTRLAYSPEHARIRTANRDSSRGQFTHWSSTVRYRNQSGQRIAATRFEWKFLDPFNQVQWVVEVTDPQELFPGDTRRRQWEEIVSQVDENIQAALSLKAVRFSDGTTWTATVPDSDTGSTDVAIRDERKRLLKLYDDQGLKALLEALRK